MKRIILAVAAVALAGGVASADRWHGGRGGSRGGGEWHGGGGHSVVVRDHREGGVRVTPSYRGNWNGGYRYERPVYNRGYTRYSYVRRPIYVERPIIRQHYYDYRYRPSLIVENYPARDGYYWVNGQWTWSGYEWIWTPGHYEPDPAYYSNGYDGYDGYCTDADGDCD
jgi:hypothetical protein